VGQDPQRRMRARVLRKNVPGSIAAQLLLRLLDLACDVEEQRPWVAALTQPLGHPLAGHCGDPPHVSVHELELSLIERHGRDSGPPSGGSTATQTATQQGRTG